MNKPTALVGRHPPALRSGLRFFAPVGISPFARYCIRNRSHDSIILRRLSTVSVGRHPSALRSGLRFFPPVKSKKSKICPFAVAHNGGYRQFRADFINLPFTPAYAFYLRFRNLCVWGIRSVVLCLS